MQFLNNQRPLAAKPERQPAPGLKPFNSQRSPVSGRPLKRLCKSLSINSVKPSQTQSNHAVGRGGDSLSPQHSPSMGLPAQRKTPAPSHSSFRPHQQISSFKKPRTNPPIPCQIAGMPSAAQSPIMHIPPKRRKTYCHAGHYLLNQAR